MWGAIGAVGSALEGVGSIANLIMQYNQQQYYKSLQKDIFAREDTAIQRRVADLKAAGLSPVLAAGQGAGTGGTVAMNTPQIDLNTEKLGLALQLMTQKKNIERTDIDIERTKEEINYLKAQQLKALAEIKGINVNTSAKYLDLKLQKETGTTSNNSGFSGLIKNVTGTSSKIGPGINDAIQKGWDDTKKRSKERNDRDKSDPIFKHRIRWFND